MQELKLQRQTLEISVYQGVPASGLVIARETAKMQVAFPKLESTFVAVLTERIIKNNFTEQKVKDAISYLMDNFHYQTPTIADVISFDKKIKLWSYEDVCEAVSQNKTSFDSFYKHWVGDTLYRVKKSEADTFGLAKYLNNEKK